jgi:hypothetical protein
MGSYIAFEEAVEPGVRGEELPLELLELELALVGGGSGDVIVC